MSQIRINQVLNYIKKRKEVTLRELCALFPDCSEMTIRRDLNALQKSGYIQRFWGGARLNEESIADSFKHSSRVVSALSEKKYIARKSLDLISESTSLYFDSGTTVLELAKILPDTPLFVITNGPIIALELQKHQNCDILLTGGSLDKTVVSLSGPIALDSLSKVNIDIAFMGAAGFSAEHGFTNALYAECELKHRAISCASKRIMLLDSEKMNKFLPYTFCNITDVDVIVTDKPLPDNLQKIADDAGVTVIF